VVLLQSLYLTPCVCAPALNQVLGPNGMVARHDLVGIYAADSTRQPRDVAGEKLQVSWDSMM
jgi:hypothetical protein